MVFSKDKKDFIWAIVSFLFFTFIFTFSVLPFYYGILLGVFIALFMLIKSEKPQSQTKQKIRDVALMIIVPPLMFFLTELLNVNGVTVFVNIPAILLNLLFYYLVEYLLFALTKKSCPALIITAIVFGALAIINGYIVEFRGFGFAVTDIHSVETGLNMLHEYIYEFNEMQLFASILTFFIIKFATMTKLEIEYHNRTAHQVLSIGLLMFMIICFTCFPVMEFFGLVPKFYYDHDNGIYLNMMGATQVLSEDKTPEGYSEEIVQKEYDGLHTDYLANYVPADKELPVNIICIMNEALGDYSIYDTFELTEDPLAYIHSLSDNTITGYTYASVYGGTTVISEYEFLSNHSSQFFGSTMSPHSTFINENSFSLAKQLSDNYHSVFIHPYKRISYNRPYAFECLGFHEQFYDKDLSEKFDKEDYYTDAGLYEIIQQMTDTSEENLFVFTVTVQNHSPYTLMDELDIPRLETGYGELADKYFSELKQSDIAFKSLIEYYSNSDEPTIIVMFGDHQAKLDSEFFEAVDGRPLKELLSDPEQKLFKTPFVIWANYPIDERNGLNISINYLSTLMLEQTGLPKTEYQYFLTQIMNKLPVITNNGFIDNNGNTYREIQELPADLKKLAQTYSYFEYNLIFEEDYVLRTLNNQK